MRKLAEILDLLKHIVQLNTGDNDLKRMEGEG